jgi:DNA polymerase/3'-5' exonuclease PolX
MAASFKSRIPLHEAQLLADQLRRAMIDLGFKRVQACGSVRRLVATVGDIDLVADGDLSLLREAADPILVLHGLLPWKFMDGGMAKCTLDYWGKQVNVLRSDSEHWGAAILYFTGPSDYNIQCRALAKRKGMLLNEKGLFKEGVCLASETEGDICRALGKTLRDPCERGKR